MNRNQVFITRGLFTIHRLGILYFAHKYLSRPMKGLAANADCGGDSIHRGSVLGAIYGASLGLSWIPETLKSELRDKQRGDKIAAHISDFTTAVVKK